MMFDVRSLLLIVCLASLAVSPPQALGQTTQTTYLATDEIFVNPERGFYKHREVQSEGGPLTLEDLQTIRQDAGISLILRLYYLKSFRSQPLSDAQLELIRNDFDTMREAGVKAVLRFAYSQSDGQPDAPLEIILQHLDQLEPIFRANSDVIAVIQAGFIGAWGEWYYSSNNLNNTADRRAVTEKILSVLPGSRMVQVRTPYYKTAIFGRATPLDASEAFSGSDVARTGHHNDCFLASETDFGTYQDLGADKAFLEQDTRFTPMGGETCNSNPPRSKCAVALEELARFHWSYLNRDYNQYVLGSWTTDGCMDEVKRRLGYRFSLLESELTTNVRPGGRFTVDIDLVNEGWAAPYNARGVEIVLRDQQSGRRYAVSLDEDVRFWAPGDTTRIRTVLGIPGDMAAGIYDTFLFLPDAHTSIRERPEYAVRLANEGVWEPQTGYNDLQVDLVVDSKVAGDDFAGGRWFQPYQVHIGTENDVPSMPRLRHAAAYPNPFQHRTNIEIDVSQTGHVRIEAFDLLGRRVAVLHDGLLNEGRSYVFGFSGEGLAGGVYVIRASGEGFMESRPVILAR